MDCDRARRLALEFQADLLDIDGIQTATSIFKAAQRRFTGMRYAGRIAETLANWHLRHVELALTVADSYLGGRRSVGFVAARPIFETAMTLAWLRTLFLSEKDQYPWLLTLIDGELVRLAQRMQSPKTGTREKAERRRIGLFEEQKEFVDEAVSVGSRGLPDLRSRIEKAEEVLRQELGQASRLEGAYTYYRVLSSYGHPTGFGSACERDENSDLRYRIDESWDLLPMMITVKEMPLLFLLVVEIADWDGGDQLAQGFNSSANAMYRHLNELYKEAMPPALLQPKFPG